MTKEELQLLIRLGLLIPEKALIGKGQLHIVYRLTSGAVNLLQNQYLTAVQERGTLKVILEERRKNG